MLIKTMNKPEALMTVTKEANGKPDNSQVPPLSNKYPTEWTLSAVTGQNEVFNQRVELEMAFIRLCSPELDSTPEAPQVRIEV